MLTANIITYFMSFPQVPHSKSSEPGGGVVAGAKRTEPTRGMDILKLTSEPCGRLVW